jgi:probable phosphoglycerate mutase
MQGHWDGDVTALGEKQRDALSLRFRDIPVDAVYSSDLYRARFTATAVTKYHPELTVQTDRRLREINVGPWEAVPFANAVWEQPELFDVFMHDPEHFYLEGAETYRQYSGRFEAALREIARAHEGQSVALFTHGCVLSGGLHRILGIPHDSSKADNTAVTLLEYENGVFSPVFLYDNSHLSEAISTRARQRWWRQQGGKFNLRYRPAAPADAALYHPDFTPAPGDRVWIALLEEEPVGYTALSGSGLACLYLRPEYRHRRFGDQLLGQAVSVLRAEGGEALQIGVPTANLEALAFFGRHCGSPVQMDDCYTVYEMEIRVN